MRPWEDWVALNQCLLYSTVLPIGGIDWSIKQGSEGGWAHYHFSQRPAWGICVPRHCTFSLLGAGVQGEVASIRGHGENCIQHEATAAASLQPRPPTWFTRLFLGTPRPHFEGKRTSRVAMAWLWSFTTTAMSSRSPIEGLEPSEMRTGSPPQVSHPD